MLAIQNQVSSISIRDVSLSYRFRNLNSNPSPFTPCCCSLRLFPSFSLVRSPRVKSVVFSCKASRLGSSGGGCDGGSTSDLDDDRDYLHASLLVPETLAHFRMLRHGLQEELRWQSTGKLYLSSIQGTDSRTDTSSLGHKFLRRFKSPTIFLKVSCDGDFLLPIIVGEFAIEKLVDTLSGDNNWDCPDQFQLVKNVVERLGHEVRMVRITERIENTYYSRLYFSKTEETDILSVDARPSDSINVASRCKVPIFVNKQIIFTDAIRIGYGMGRQRDARPTYDVSLDSAADGPDSMAEELATIKNLNLAVKEERYDDAAMWRDKLLKIRKSRQEQEQEQEQEPNL